MPQQPCSQCEYKQFLGTGHCALFEYDISANCLAHSKNPQSKYYVMHYYWAGLTRTGFKIKEVIDLPPVPILSQEELK